MIGTDSYFLDIAISKAWEYQLLTYPNPAVGAVITIDGKLLSVEAHQKAGTSHAEVLAFLSAYESLSGEQISFDRFDAHKAHEFLLSLEAGFFSQTTLFVTLEPCSHIGKTPSCSSLILKLQPLRVVIAKLDPIDGHGGGAGMLEQQGIKVDIIESKEANDLLEPFMIWQNRAFVVFKLAQTLNGNVGGGYISSKESLTLVHRYREVCSSMLIGGNTVRIDRPTLDCRFLQANPKAPDVYIYSRQKEFDKSIPLFDVVNRSVHIVDNVDFLDKPSFVLIEGTGSLLDSLHSHVDWLLNFVAPKFSNHSLSYNVEMNLEFLKCRTVDGKDILIWSRNSGQ